MSQQTQFAEGVGPSGKPSPPIQVLLVEDDADAASTASRLLRIWGCEIRTAPDGERGVEEASRFRPDLVLVDIQLPKMDGYEVARRLRQDSRLRTVPLVAMSGGIVREELRVQAEKAGFTSVLIKPIEPEQLLSWVEAVRKTRQLQAEPGAA